VNWLAGRTIAISVSVPEDVPQHGMGPEHFNDAMGEITRQLLALGARLMYGGDLRAGGITRMLFELAARYFPASVRIADHLPAIVDVIPYYAHAELAAEDLDAWEAEFAGVGQLQFMSPEGDRAWTLRERPDDLIAAPRDRWADSLTAMRAYVTGASDARVVVGGKMTGYLGRMPGIEEEVYASLSAGKPLFVVGGFGGAAHPIARRIGAGEPIRLPDPHGIAIVRPNGLLPEELHRLAVSPHIDEVVVLIVRGLRKLFVRE
jgi:SLOG cluster2